MRNIVDGEHRFLCRDDCESLGKWPSVLHPEDLFIDVNCYFLPKLLEARKAQKRLRIWSAACSSGEEPYTLAIQVHRSLGVRLSDWRIEILGTDISEKVLEIAQSGKYTNYSTRTVPPLVMQRYFKQEGQYAVLDPSIRSMVHFETHNLKDRLAARRHGTWDVIFCRNVMIYFDDAMKKDVLKTFN